MRERDFRLVDITAPVPPHRKRLLMQTSIAGDDSGDVRQVEDGLTFDVETSIADRLIDAGQAVEFKPATVLAHLMKVAGVSRAALASHHMAGLPAALRAAKITAPSS